MSGASCRDWQSTLNQASFKGFAFEVARDSVTGGRRIVTHEYPGRDFWDNEDLGRSKQIIDVNGYIVGDDADSLANEFLRLCNSRGAGSLVLPTRGAVQARCISCERGFEEDKLGRIEIAAKFVEESGGLGGLAPVSMLFGAVVQAAASAIGLLAGGFEQTYNAKAGPGLARVAAADTVRLAARTLRTAIIPVPIDTEAEPVILHRIAVLERDAGMLAGAGRERDTVKPLSVVTATGRQANTMASLFSGVFTSVAQSSSSRAELARALEPMIAFAAQPITNINIAPSVVAEKQLTGLIARYVAALATVKWIEAVSLTEYTTRDDVIAARSAISGVVESKISGTVTDAEIQAFSTVRDAAVMYLSQGVAARRARVRTLLLPGPYAAIAVAHELYGDPTRDAEILSLNGWDNPMLLPPECKVAAS